MNSVENKPFSLANFTIAKKVNSKKSTAGTKKLKEYQLRVNIQKAMFQFSESSFEALNMKNNGLSIAFDDNTVCLMIASEADSKFYKHKGDTNKGYYFKSTVLLDLLRERKLIIEDKKINYFTLANIGISGNFMVYEMTNIEPEANKVIGGVAAAEIIDTQEEERLAAEHDMEEEYVAEHGEEELAF